MSDELLATSESTDSIVSPPPLRIHHFMACAVVTALELSLLRFMLHRSPQQSMINSGLFAFTQVLSAIGLTLTGFSVYWWRKGYASFSEPGQMLLLHYAVNFVLQLMSIAFSVAMTNLGGTVTGGNEARLLAMVFSFGSLAVGAVVPLLFYGWCAWKIADTQPWRTLFILCAVMSLMSVSLVMIVVRLMVPISPANIKAVFSTPLIIRGTFLLPVGAIAVVNDLARQRERSWTHWMGLILWLLGLVGSLVVAVLYIFLPPVL